MSSISIDTLVPVESPLLCCSFTSPKSTAVQFIEQQVVYSYKTKQDLLRTFSFPALVSTSTPPLSLRDLHSLGAKASHTLHAPIILVRGGCLVVYLPPLRALVSQHLVYFFPSPLGMDAATLWVLGELEGQLSVEPLLDLRYATLGACSTAAVSALGAQVALLKEATESCLSAIPTRELPSPQVSLEARNCKQATALIAKELGVCSNALDAFLAHPSTATAEGGVLGSTTPSNTTQSMVVATMCAVGAHLDALEAQCAQLQQQLEHGEQTLALNLETSRRVVSKLELAAMSTCLFLSTANLIFSYFAMNLRTGDSFVYSFEAWVELVTLSMGCALLISAMAAYFIFHLPNTYSTVHIIRNHT